MTRILNEERREEVGGRHRQREREREGETMNPAPTERNNSSPNFKA